MKIPRSDSVLCYLRDYLKEVIGENAPEQALQAGVNHILDMTFDHVVINQSDDRLLRLVVANGKTTEIGEKYLNIDFLFVAEEDISTLADSAFWESLICDAHVPHRRIQLSLSGNNERFLPFVERAGFQLSGIVLAGQVEQSLKALQARLDAAQPPSGVEVRPLAEEADWQFLDRECRSEKSHSVNHRRSIIDSSGTIIAFRSSFETRIREGTATGSILCLDGQRKGIVIGNPNELGTAWLITYITIARDVRGQGLSHILYQATLREASRRGLSVRIVNLAGIW